MIIIAHRAPCGKRNAIAEQAILCYTDKSLRKRNTYSEHAFFGTDFPLRDCDEAFSSFFEIPLTYSEYEMILAGNLKKFLGV